MQQVPMKEIPAKCGNCGYLFPSGYSFDPQDTGIEATMIVSPTAPVSRRCPICDRQKGRVLDGEYNFIKDTITLLSGSESTVEDLERLSDFLRAAKQGASVEEIQEKADREKPDLSTFIRKLLASRPDQVDPVKWLSLLIGIISLLAQLKIIGSPEQPDPSQVWG